MPEPTPITEKSQRSRPIGAEPSAGYTEGMWRAAVILMLLSGLASAVGSQLIFQVRELFQIAPERLGMPPHPPAIERELFLYGVANHALGFGFLGLLIGGGLGLGMGVLSRSCGAVVRASVVGSALGLLMGAAGGAAAFLIYESMVAAPLDGIFKAVLIHLPNWLLLSVALAATGLCVRRLGTDSRRIFTSSLMAGFLAALLYPLVALLLFPAANSDRPIPFELGPRLLCFVLGAVILGFATARWLPTPSAAAT